MPTKDELARLRQLQAQCEADFRANAAQHPELCTPGAHARFKDHIHHQRASQGGAMPAKGYKTLGEELENVAMRLPRSVLAQVDEHIETLRRTAPWAKVGRSDALRDLVVRGLASLPQPTPEAPEQPTEAQQTDKPPVPSTQAGSAPRGVRGATRPRTRKAAPVV